MCKVNFADPDTYLRASWSNIHHSSTYFGRSDGVFSLTAFHKRRILHYTQEERMAKESKRDRLSQLGALNPRPERVQAPWFREAGFFDPQDFVQVKYEMLRHVREEGANKADAAALFGLSRPTYYQAETAFERDGIAGLLPRTRGPKAAHKLTGEVMQIVEEHLAAHGPLQARSLAELVHARLGISVHPRSIERALARKKKR
jgi:transposase